VLRLAALALLSLSAVAAGQPRYMPPAGVGCSRDRLTSFTGRVTAYSRSAARIRLTLHTDENTVERFVLKAPFKLLFQGEPFRESDWARIETRPGRLRPGVRATMWVCEDGGRMLDWQTPPETR
jgi:hypothetical protein